MELSRATRPGGQVVLTLSGRLDLVSARSLRSGVAAEVATGHPRIVVDLSKVPFIDSSGIGALIGSLRHAREADGELRIAGPGEQVREVLHLTTVDRIFTPYPTVDEALHGL